MWSLSYGLPRHRDGFVQRMLVQTQFQTVAIFVRLFGRLLLCWAVRPYPTAPAHFLWFTFASIEWPGILWANIRWQILPFNVLSMEEALAPPQRRRAQQELLRARLLAAAPASRRRPRRPHLRLPSPQYSPPIPPHALPRQSQLRLFERRKRGFVLRLMVFIKIDLSFFFFDKNAHQGILNGVCDTVPAPTPAPCPGTCPVLAPNNIQVQAASLVL